jgi:hypothetical protein
MRQYLVRLFLSYIFTVTRICIFHKIVLKCNCERNLNLNVDMIEEMKKALF